MPDRHEKSSIFILDPSHAHTGAFVGSYRIAQLLSDHANCHLLQSDMAVIEPTYLKPFKQLHLMPLVHMSRRTSDLLGYFPALLHCSWRIHKLIRRHHASILILNDFYLMHGVMLRIMGFRGQIITYVRAHPQRLVGRIASPMLRLIGLTSNHVVAVSRYIQALLPRYLNATLIYDAIIPPSSTITERRTWNVSDAKTILFIGNYIEGKGQDVALEAFAKAAQQDATLSLDFYGSNMGLAKNRAYRDGLEQRAQQLGIAERVHFNNFADDTASLLRDAFAVINASVSESFSLVVLEACAAGVAVIATKSGGPQEIIVDGETGYLVPVGDADAIAERLTALAANPDHAAALGFAAKAHVAQRFSPDLQREQLIALLGLTNQL